MLTPITIFIKNVTFKTGFIEKSSQSKLIAFKGETTARKKEFCLDHYDSSKIL